jgi:AraC-like DNA-binding protein
MVLPRVRSAALTNYVDVARSLGIDPYAQLRAAGIDVRCLTHPDLRIPVQRVSTLLESSAHAAGVEDFGLRMALMRRLSNLGLIALAAREQPTVREALLCLQRTLHLHIDAMLFEIEEANDVVVLRERILARVHGSIRQSVELTIAVLYQAIKEFLGDGWAPRTVCFMHGRPRDISRYRKAFNCSVQFDSVLNGITCRSRDLDRPMPRADPQSLRAIQQVLDATIEREPTYAKRTTQLIVGLLPGGRCTADFVANYLGIDRRTLHRKLAAERTSFTELMDDVRREAAQRHLTDGDQAIADLAPMLGFSDASALSRWFSGQFGCPPRAWRLRARR